MPAWGNYYVILGSAAAALIGIQFVVMTLIAAGRKSAPPETIRAFATPTVVHFAGVLLVSAVMTVPWPSLYGASVALAVGGFGGLVYGFVVIRRTHRQTGYKPLWQDWLWYTILPCTANATLAAAAVFLTTAAEPVFFVAAGSALGLLLIGIHNAWDTVIHIVITRATRDETEMTS
jgi:hypothetical protein